MIKLQEETTGSNKEVIEQIARRVCQAIIAGLLCTVYR